MPEESGYNGSFAVYESRPGICPTRPSIPDSAYQAPIMHVALILALSFAHLPNANAAPPPARAEELLVEDRLLAKLPEGMTLDFPAESFGGQIVQRAHSLRWSPDGRRVA